MTLWSKRSGWTCGIFAALVAIGACAAEPVTDEASNEDDAATIAQALTPGACTAVTLTSPTPGWTAELGQAIPLSATATCPPGSTPEFRYWAKPAGAANWTFLGTFVPGASSFTPPTLGSWQITAVVRAVGSTDTYQARAMSAAGTVTPVNHPPVAGDDFLTVNQNAAGAIDVAGNDSDPDGDPFAVTSHTNPSHGSVTFAGSIATYTPGTGFVGGDSFTYTIGDGRGGSATATVSVTVTNQAPIAGDDVIATFGGAPAQANVLANDSDPDGDAITVVSFTQGAHGTVTIANGIATYSPPSGFDGTDRFTYTIADSHGATATAAVDVTINSQPPVCAIAITGPDSATLGDTIHLTASAVCSTGPVQIEWRKRINNAFIVVQPFGPSPVFDFTTDTVGTTTFMAFARVQGSTPVVVASNPFNVKIADNVAPCTAVQLTSPVAGQALGVGIPATLTASATCPAGTTPEFQFWVKPAGAANWTVLPGFTTGAGSWTPPSTGAWSVRAVVRTTTSHVNYQAVSAGVPVTVTP